MVECVRIFHQVLQFLRISGVKDRVSGTTPLATEPCEASQNTWLGRKVFRIRYSEKPLQDRAKSLSDLPTVSPRPIPQVRPKQGMIAVVLGHRGAAHIPHCNSGPSGDSFDFDWRAMRFVDMLPNAA